MKINIAKITLVVALVGLLGACSMSRVYHGSLMNGQVVQVEENQVVVCVGTDDGAKPGMEFEVFKVLFEGTIMEGTDNYRLEKVGEIEVVSIVDGHFARALITDGSVDKFNVVELKK